MLNVADYEWAISAVAAAIPGSNPLLEKYDAGERVAVYFQLKNGKRNAIRLNIMDGFPLEQKAEALKKAAGHWAKENENA